MATVIIKHRVANFDAWKQAFDAMTSSRKENGWTGHIVLRDANDSNVVTIVNRVRDLEGAKRYAGSPALRAAMENGGVQGPPEVSFLQDCEDIAY